MSSPAGQHGDVLQHGLAAVAEARRLDGGDLQTAAQLVDHEGGECLALDVLGDDEQRLARLHHQFEQGQQRLKPGEFLLVDEDVRALELGHHLLGIGDEVRRDIAAVELHALDHFEFDFEAFGLFDGDHALIADLLHRLGDHLADFLFAVRGDRANLGDLLRRLDLLGLSRNVLHDLAYCQIDAALQVHRIHTGCDQLDPFLHNRLSQHCRGGGAIAGDVAGLRCHFAQHLRTHVLELIFEFDLLGDGDFVLGDARRTKALVEDDVAAFGPKRHPDSVGEDIDAVQHLVACVGGKSDVLGSHFGSPKLN